MVGDPSDPSSTDKSIVGTTKRWFKEAVNGGSKFLFGSLSASVDGGSSMREGGLFGGVAEWFSGKSKDIKSFLMGSGEAPGGGLLGGLREKFDKLTKRVGESLFGTVGADGRRGGGFLGDHMQRGSDMVRGLWDRITPTSCRWSQALSYDDGKTWQDTWRMDWTRA